MEKGLASEPTARFATAHEMATALESLLEPARPARVGSWVEEIAGAALEERRKRVAAIEGLAVEGPGTSAEVLGLREPKRPGAHDPAATQPVLDVPAANAISRLVEETGTRAPVTQNVEPARRARRMIPIGLAGGALVIALAAGARYQGSKSSSSETGPLAPSAAVPAASSVAPPASLPSGALEAVASASASAPAQASAPAHASATSKGTTPTVPAHATAPQRPRAKPTCDPPFYFDHAGVKRFKPGCV